MEALEWHDVVDVDLSRRGIDGRPRGDVTGNGVIDVFVRGTNGALYRSTTTNGGSTWGAWTNLGGQLASRYRTSGLLMWRKS